VDPAALLLILPPLLLLLPLLRAAWLCGSTGRLHGLRPVAGWSLWSCAAEPPAASQPWLRPPLGWRCLLVPGPAAGCGWCWLLLWLLLR
jgi:hypothetical protein